MVELRLINFCFPFSFDCNEFKFSCFGYYVKDEFMLKHPNYILRQRLLFGGQLLVLFFMKIVIFSQISPKNSMLNLPKMRWLSVQS